MKKLTLSLLSILMAFTLVFAAGCGSVFDGNYSKITAEEAETFLAELPDTGNVEEDFYSNGISVETVVDISGMKVSLNYKAVLNDGIMNASGKTEVSITGGGESVNVKSDFYYKDDTVYINATGEGQTIKYKQKIPFSEYVNGETEGFTELNSVADIEYLKKVYASSDNAELYLDRTDENQTKIKIVVPAGNTVDNQEVDKFEIYYILNAENICTAFRMIYVVDSEYLKLNMDMIVQEWNGSISFPSDLDTYSEAEEIW